MPIIRIDENYPGHFTFSEEADWSCWGVEISKEELVRLKTLDSLRDSLNESLRALDLKQGDL